MAASLCGVIAAAAVLVYGQQPRTPTGPPMYRVDPFWPPLPNKCSMQQIVDIPPGIGSFDFDEDARELMSPMAS